MEVNASYDVVNESYCRKNDSSDSEATEDEMDAEKIGTKLKSLFRRRKLLRKRLHSEVAEAPTAYWEIASEQFERALSLRPQLSSLSRRSMSLTNIIEECDSTGLGGVSFKSVGNLLTLDEDEAELNFDDETHDRDHEVPMKKEKRVRFAALKQLKSFIQVGGHSDDVDVKILVLGDRFVGKTAVIRRFVHGEFDAADKKTRPNYETKLMKLQSNEQFCLHIFDIRGEIHAGIFTSAAITDAIGACIVFDVNDPKSFASIKKWKREIDSKARQANKRRKVPCILLANKCDSADTSFNMLELDTYCSKRGIVCWFDTSAKSDFNIKNAFVYLTQRIIDQQKALTATAPKVDTKKKKLGFSLSFKKRNVQYEEECSTVL